MDGESEWLEVACERLHRGASDAWRDSPTSGSPLNTTCRVVLCVLALGLATAAEVVAQDTGTREGVLAGRVLDVTTGKVVMDATVSLPVLSRSVRTDSLGRFRVSGIPVGEVVLTASAVGYQPVRATLTLSAGVPLELDVELEPVTPLLDSVRVSATTDEPRNVALKEFESRRITGLGRFLTRDDLLVDRGRSLDGILRARVPGLRVVNDGHRKVAASGRASGNLRRAEQCLLSVFVDGVLRYENGRPSESFDLRTLEASMIAAIEIYTVATLPAEFNLGGNTSCGALVIWLQH